MVAGRGPHLLSALLPRVVLDNTVISSLHVAGALPRVLLLWKGSLIVPLQVRDEAAAWKAHGGAVMLILNQLRAGGAIEYATPEPGPEGALFAQLARIRGQGESAAIAIAYHRQAAVATDDRQARRSCQSLSPPGPTIATEDLLTEAVRLGLLALAEAQAVWNATGIRDPIRDPNRGIKI